MLHEKKTEVKITNQSPTSNSNDDLLSLNKDGRGFKVQSNEQQKTLKSMQHIPQIISTNPIHFQPKKIDQFKFDPDHKKMPVAEHFRRNLSNSK